MTPSDVRAFREFVREQIATSPSTPDEVASVIFDSIAALPGEDRALAGAILADEREVDFVLSRGDPLSGWIMLVERLALDGYSDRDCIMLVYDRRHSFPHFSAFPSFQFVLERTLLLLRDTPDILPSEKAKIAEGLVPWRRRPAEGR